MIEICRGFIYLPTGMDPGHFDAGSFQIDVVYRGTYPHKRNGGEPVAWYSVEQGGNSLSRAGKWAFAIRRFQYQQYRFTLDEAKDWAARLVDEVSVMGTTWAQWQEQLAARKAATQQPPA